MKKYQPGGEQRMDTRNQPNPVSPIMKEPPNSAPVNASQPQAPQAPVTPITSSATGAAPDVTMEAYNRNIAMGMRPRKARNMAMKETGIKSKVDPNAVIGAIGKGLDLANQSAGTIGAFRSAFRQNGGQMSGKQLRKTSAFMQEGGSVGKPMNMEKKRKIAAKSKKKYDEAGTAYSKGNAKKGDRKKAKGAKLFKKSQSVMKYGGTKSRKK